MGFASGFQAGANMARMRQEMERERQEMERRRKEEERQEAIRREAMNTLGNVGQQREDGSTYTEEDAYSDYAKNVAQYDVGASMDARVKGLQLKGAKRQERYANLEEKWLDFQRRMLGADDDTYIREAAKFATQAIPDGRSFGIDFDPNSGYSVVLVDQEGRAMRRPIGSRWDVEMMLSSYISPHMYKTTQELGLKRRATEAEERRAGAAERQARAAEANAQRMREFYAPGGVYERTHGASVRAAGAAANAKPFSTAGQLQDGTPVVFNANTGRYTNGITGEPLTAAQLKLFQKVTGERPQTPEALGSTGYIRIGNDIFAPDPKDPNKLVRVQLPGQSIADRLRAAVRPGAPMMPPARGLPKPKYSPAEVAAQRNFGFLTPDDLLMQAVEAGVPGAIAELERRRRVREQNQRDAFGLMP